MFDQRCMAASWLTRLCAEFDKDYMTELAAFLQRERSAGKRIFPEPDEYFRALSLSFDKVKVVILGQDPYHGPGQAHGLAFSVRPETPPPPSLKNIFRELTSDLGLPLAPHGHLKPWADRGVFLLNSVLTVEAGKAGSHRNRGWERFTDRIVGDLNRERDKLVFLLWGRDAQEKGRFIDRTRHHVLTAPHPSPLSARRGFLGCRHFSRTNIWLVANGLPPMDWRLQCGSGS